MLNESEADAIHCDIMDGVFVPNISFGFPVMHYINKYAEKPLAVHLMIVDPEKYISRFRDAGAETLIVHLEVCNHLNRVVEEIRSTGMKAGVALNPHTPVNLLEDILSFIDMVLIMSVNPGYGGQSFIEHTYERVQKLRMLSERINPDLVIAVDGGVDMTNAALLYNSGVNTLVSGTTIFKADDPKNMIRMLKNTL